MRRTVFNTPVVRHFFHALSWVALKLTGWEIKGPPPAEKKYVLIGAPHTSNWDFPLGLAIFFVLKFDVTFLGKHTLFWGPFGVIMRWLGGLPVDRRSSHNVVEEMTKTMKDADRMILVIAPEGTRSKVDNWKRGFYHIAHGAGVPIYCGFVDFENKQAGIGPIFHTTGDVDKDMVELQAFYKGIKGKRPELGVLPHHKD